MNRNKIDKKILELDSILFFKEYSRAFKSRLLFAVEIHDFYKGQVVFKEGNKDNKLYFIVRGEFEVTKKMTIHSDPRLPLIEYNLLEPSLDNRLKYSAFFENHENLISGENTRGIDEIRRFLDKRSTKNLVIRIIGASDTLGLEEVIMQSPQRILNAKCTSKKARIISIEGKALFSRIKRADIMEMFEQTALKKLMILSKIMRNFNDHLLERKQTINTDRIMERIEYLEPMITDIYLRSDK